MPGGERSPAPRAAVRRLPSAPGVYRFSDERDRVLYIGRANDLRRRAASYWADLGDRGHLAPMVDRIRRVEAVVCDSAHEAAWLERNLLERELPEWNRSRGGEEVPAYVCLHTGRSGPRLTVAHRPPRSERVRCFGPYLGGAKVRLAVAALHRVFPLGSAGQDAGGSTLELARARGLDTIDPAGVTGRVMAVLQRDPPAMEAVQEALLLRRDDAAARLAFEVSARVQAESEALAWVLAEQKVTVQEPVDLDLHGWADGVLVRFEVRSGRLCGWVQQPGSRAAARARLAATPEAWRHFAERNAVLAASLRRAPDHG